jgi:hypothetical protein
LSVAVDAGFIAYLKSEGLYTSAPSPNAAQWPKGSEAVIMSPILTRANAVTEATRQAAFLGGPNAKDRVLVKGLRRDLIGKCITVKNARLGYGGVGAKVFVLGAQENANRTTTLTVVKRLP